MYNYFDKWLNLIGKENNKMNIKFPNGKKLYVFYNCDTNETTIYFNVKNKIIGKTTPAVIDRVRQLRFISLKYVSNYDAHLREMTNCKNKLFELLGGSANE